MAGPWPTDLFAASKLLRPNPASPHQALRQPVLRQRRRRRAAGVALRALPIIALLLLLLNGAAPTSRAADGGSVSGTVEDASSAVVPGARVTATNTDTGVAQQVATNGRGFYSFPDLPVGRYDVSIAKPGFQTYRRTGIAIDANGSVVVDATLAVGAQAGATVTVSAGAVHAETSDTQMGEVVTAEQMTAVPLNGRSYTDLLALQPGVVPATSITSDTVQDVGATVLNPSGDLNPGTISINGQREFSNGFTVNGSDTEEDVNAGTAIIPNLDSIAEFRILTSDADAEYGGHSGGQINVITKSGANQFHGDLFEFLRNTSLDAKNFFSPTRGAYDQNQFGGTFGGPLGRPGKKNKLFFFVDYQGTRLLQGVDTGLIPVPSLADRGIGQPGGAANLSDLASEFENAGGQPNTVSGTYLANTYASELGETPGSVYQGEPYYYTQGEIVVGPGNPTNNPSITYPTSCTSTSQCVFPNAVIPRSVWSAPGQNLLQYIPLPNVGTNDFSTSAYNQTLRNDKGAIRLDYHSPWGLLTGYYFLDDASLNNPYPIAQSGASVPGFNALYLTRAQLISLSHSKSFGSSALNEFHFSYMRDNNDLGVPIGGVGTSLASQGFVTGAGTPGITPLAPQIEGVENIDFNSFSIGTNANELRQVNNTFQWIDNFSKISGRHSLKFGVEFHYDQINTNPIAQANGNFIFSGSETGVDFSDFLLGVPSEYNQSQLQPFYGRNKYLALYAEDSWRLRPNLTLNYGLRWDRIEPWYEKNNGISTFIPGQQSVVFPGAPAGILFPTDPGVSRTLAPPCNLCFAPRVGLAWSPSAPADTILGKLLGGAGKTSIRAAFGIYYTDIEALAIAILADNGPFGTTYSSPGSPLFATPFITAATGEDQGNPFPVTAATGLTTASNPNVNINWSQYLPISGVPAYDVNNRIPYTDEYSLSFQRQLGANTVVSASYIGNSGHRQLVLVEANPGNPGLCLSLSTVAEVAPGSPTCGPYNEDEVFTSASGTLYKGTRGPLGSNFGSNTLQETIGHSAYNALELSLRHTSGPLTVAAGYTYSKCMDDSSNLGEEVNPGNTQASSALCSFDVRHNFVVSYSYQLPLQRLFHSSDHPGWSRLVEGWQVSGITHFSTGLPVTLASAGDNSLLGTYNNGINNFTIDEPDYTPGSLNLNHNPANGQPYFNTALFSMNTEGTQGNAPRRFFSGPGLDNFDVALAKHLRLTESKSLEFRVEAFNVFNHPQFFGPNTVDGDVTTPSSFGQVVSADPPRLLQLAAKFLF